MIVILRLYIHRLTANFLYLFFIVFIISCILNVFKGKIASVGLTHNNNLSFILFQTFCTDTTLLRINRNIIQIMLLKVFLTLRIILSKRTSAPDSDQHNANGNKQQEMNKITHRIATYRPQQPQNYQYHSNRPQDVILLSDCLFPLPAIASPYQAGSDHAVYLVLDSDYPVVIRFFTPFTPFTSLTSLVTTSLFYSRVNLLSSYFLSCFSSSPLSDFPCRGLDCCDLAASRDCGLTVCDCGRDGCGLAAFRTCGLAVCDCSRDCCGLTVSRNCGFA
jgi:hypothetical protein